MSTDGGIEKHRGRLFGIAYRMLGTVAEAEDAVQAAYTRLAAAGDEVDDPAAWLTTVTTNLCIDRLRSAQRQREDYVGPWLPEPLLTDDRDPADIAGTADSLTFAFLVVLERLSPLERAVFLLHDVFGYQHDEIAAMLGRSPSAVRQLASRARGHLQDDQPRYEHDADRRRAVAEAYLEASEGGDMGRLMELLAPDVVFTSDGGGVVSAARRPVVGAENVARFALGLSRLADAGGWNVRLAEVNGQPGIIGIKDGEVGVVISIHVVDGRIEAVHAMRNPAKLERIRTDLSGRA